MRAHALYQLRRWDDAVETARAGLSRHPHDVTLLDRLALSELEAGRPARAEAAFDEALQLEPQNLFLLSHFAFLLARTKRYDEARAAVAKALEVAPESAVVLRTRAQVAVLSQDPRADEYSRDLLSLEPDAEDVHLLSGTAAARARRIDDALDHYVEAARLNPGDARIAWVGRRSRALRHPLAAPLRLFWKLGPRRVQIGLILVLAAAGAAGLPGHAILGIVSFLVIGYLVAARSLLRVRFGKRPR